MNFAKRISLSILTCISLSLLSYVISFLGQIGFPLVLTNIINIILGIIVSSLLLKLFFQKFCSQNCSWLTYIPLALMISVLCGIAVRIVGGISPVVSEIFWDKFEIEKFLLGFVNFLQGITRIILTYYFISVIEKMDLDTIDPCETSNKEKLNYLSISIGAILDFVVNSFSIFMSLTDYLRYNAVRIIVFVLVMTLLIIGIASWGAMVIINNDIGWQEEWHKCYNCNGSGKVTNDFGWKVKCPSCDGVGSLYY